MIHKHLDIIARQENGRFRGLILTGRPGIGKTSALMAMKLENDEFCRIPMAVRTAEDFGVYPVPDKAGVYTDEKGVERTLWEIVQPLIESQLVPFLEGNIGDRYGIVLLDDVTLGDPRVQSGLLELVQFGRIGNFQLGKNVLIAMTGNGIEDECDAAPWSKALLGRSQVVTYEPDFDEWVDLPCNKHLDHTVVGFLKSVGAGFFAPNVGDNQASDANGKTPSPRDWTALGENFGRFGGVKNFPKNKMFKDAGAYSISMVGQKAGMAYTSFIKTMLDYPLPEELLENPNLWNKLPKEKKNDYGSVFGVVHGIRSLVLRKSEAILSDTKLSEAKKDAAWADLAKKFAHAIAPIMKDNKGEMCVFALRYILAGASDKNNIGSCLADLAYNVVDDPVLKEAGLDKAIEDIRGTSQVLGSNDSIGKMI